VSVGFGRPGADAGNGTKRPDQGSRLLARSEGRVSHAARLGRTPAFKMTLRRCGRIDPMLGFAAARYARENTCRQLAYWLPITTGASTSQPSANGIVAAIASTIMTRP